MSSPNERGAAAVRAGSPVGATAAELVGLLPAYNGAAAADQLYQGDGKKVEVTTVSPRRKKMTLSQKSLSGCNNGGHQSASCFSKFFFIWLYPLLWTGRKKTLDIHDVDPNLPEDEATLLKTRFQQAWASQQSQVQKGGSLLRALLSVFGIRYFALGLVALFEECVLRIGQPLCLGLLMRYFAGEFPADQGYLFAGGVVLLSAWYVAQHHPFFFALQHNGMKMRVSLTSLVYSKLLKLSSASLSRTTSGQIINLLANDVTRLDMSKDFMHYIWIAPIQLLLVTYILWGYFGPLSSLSGLTILLLFLPFQSGMGRLFGKLRGEVALKTDNRLRITAEVFKAIRAIKCYAWEVPFTSQVTEARRAEIKVLKKTAFLRAINQSVYYVSSKIVIFLTLLTYVLTGNRLTAEKVFVTLALYNNVRMTFTLFLPYGMAQLAEILVSIKRLQAFLLLEERETAANVNGVQAVGNSEAVVAASGSAAAGEALAIEMKNISAKWRLDSPEECLSNISFTAKKGELVGVSGSTGSGKGSLIQVLLGELPPTAGYSKVHGKISYCSQEPWIINGTIRQNILLGSDFEPTLYAKVVEACCLASDLKLMSSGDGTLVGDNGASLSGGQKARISLARAIYFKADVYLLDDPLSAVDARVALNIFNSCIKGLLSSKTVLFVTHQPQFLKEVDKILVLAGGRLEAYGTFDEIMGMGASPNLNELLEEEIAGNESASTTSSAAAELQQPELAIAAAVVEEARPPGDENMSSEGSAPEKQEQGLETPSRIQSEAKLYWKYIREGSSIATLAILIASNVLAQLAFTGSDYCLKYWTKSEQEFQHLQDDGESSKSNVFNNATTTSSTPAATATVAAAANSNEERRNLQVGIYAGFIGVLFLMSFIRTILFFKIALKSSVGLHNRLFSSVLRSPLAFFETNPVGRILNRCAKDIGVIDDTLPLIFFDTIEVVLQVLGILIVVCVVNPILLIPSAFVCLCFYLIRNLYLRSAQSLKRLEGNVRSPIFSHVSSTLAGLPTLRALQTQQHFEAQFAQLQNQHSSVWYLCLASARWLGVTVDWVSIIYIGSVTFILMASRSEGEAEVGLAISSAMALTGLMQWGVKQSAETANQIVCVERVLEYVALPAEGSPEPSSTTGSPASPLAAVECTAHEEESWPEHGEIKLQAVTLCYCKGATPTLKGISALIKPKEKIGIVGRTGAGKSSIISALLRLVEIEPTGSIVIDGVDIAGLKLQHLRSKISIIPQEPILFTGSLRMNLDPLCRASCDEELWSILKAVRFSEFLKELPDGLDTKVQDGGSNFSVGQRQLICLGRVILAKNRIVILDEATANLDQQTDALIQATIREQFADCTVLTVAHRLQTVMDSDRILVLDNGSIQEFDEPYTLLCKEEGRSSLAELVSQTGASNAATLLQIAKEAHEKRFH